MAIFISFDSFDIGYFVDTLQHTMQHAACSVDPFDMTLDLAKVAFLAYQFLVGMISLIFPIIYQIDHLS